MESISLSALRQLGDCSCFRSRDLDETTTHISRLFKQHRLSIVGRKQKLDVQIGGMAADSFSLLYHRHHARVRVEPEQFENFFLLQIPVRGSGRVVIDRREFDIDRNHGVMISPLSDVRMEFDEGCEQLILRISRREMECFLEQELGRMLDAPLQFSSEVRLDASTSHEILLTLKYMTTLFGTDSDTSSGSLVIKTVAPLIIGMLLQGLEHNYSDLLKREKDNCQPTFLKRAQEYMAANLSRTLTLEEIAQAANISPRAMHYTFRKHLNVSPMRHLRDLRMDEAHRLLLLGKPVSYVALQVGFQHFSHFSAVYRARFGHLPSSTVRLRR